MRYLVAILIYVLSLSNALAQSVYGAYAQSANAINLWEKNSEGYYTLKQNVSVDVNLSSLTTDNIYSYDKKSARLYVRLDNCNCIVSLTSTSNDVIKKQMKRYKVPNLKPDELISKEQEINETLLLKFSKLNETTRLKKLEEERKAKEAAARKAREDSIRMDNYRREHNWHILHVNKSLYCEECEESHYCDSVYVIAISKDSISYMNFKPDKTVLYSDLRLVHYGAISNEFSKDVKFQNYCTMWKDSISDHEYKSGDVPYLMNRICWGKFFESVEKDAPYGYIIDWGWELNSVAGIEARFEYHNTYKKTIKYIDFYFSVYNAVGDICPIQGSGNVAHVRGIGPVEQWESSSWSWDRASHYTSYSASNMKIVKLVITYMDGSVRTIPKNQIVFE